MILRIGGEFNGADEMVRIGKENEKQEIKNDISKHQRRRKQYAQTEKQLKESGEPQISTSDPDSKHMIVRNNMKTQCT